MSLTNSSYGLHDALTRSALMQELISGQELFEHTAKKIGI